ncbi:MAG TPA: gamma-glutamyltransferase, partial [Thermopetrobacter sp.]|nr:gamma-glutamyltransferase [Thermopetrobacter sp.]
MTGGHGAVAAGHELTVAAAKQALAAGGTAVDAAVAAAWMACVAEPVLASPGGGGFAMVGAAGETPVLCDFFAQTPKWRNPQAVFGAAGCDFGDATQVFHVGHGSTATPGFVPGLFALHERFGRLPMAALIGPAAQAAARGFTVTPFQEYLMGVVESILGHSASARRVFLPRGRLPKAGERFANPDLAAFLRLLAGGGLAAHAEDVIPRILGQQRAAGHLRDDDVADYAVAWRAPLRVQRGDGVVWLNPPPAAGGVMIALALAALDEAGMRDCPAGAMAAALAAADDA